MPSCSRPRREGRRHEPSHRHHHRAAAHSAASIAARIAVWRRPREPGRHIPRARGYRRVLVVSDAFNAGRVGRLDLLGEAAVFGEVRPEPAKCKNQGSGRTNPARIQSHATQT